MQYLYKKIYIIGIIFFSLLIIAYIIYNGNLHSFYGDDFQFGIYYHGEGIFDCLLKDAGKMHGGGYFSLFLTKIFCTKIPLMLNIHPADFMNRGQAFFQALFLICLFISYVNFFQYTKKFKSMYFILYLFISVLFFYTGVCTGGDYFLVNNNNFWRYPFTFLFLNIFFLSLYNYIANKKTSIQITKYLLFLFSGTVCFANQELIIYICALLILLIGVYNLLIKILFKNNPNLLFNLNIKNYIIPLFLNFTIMTLYLNSEGYKFLHNYRVVQNIDNIKNYILNFCDSYFQCIFKDFIIYWVIFLILFFISIYLQRRKKEDFVKIVLPLLLEISTLITMFSLVVCDKNVTNFMDHGGLKLTFRMISYIPIFIYLDYIIQNIGKYRRKVINTIYIFFLVISVFMCRFVISENKLRNHQNKMNQINYIGEKMLRFYYLKNETPILYRYDDNEGPDNLYKTELYFYITDLYLDKKEYGFMPEKSHDDVICNNMNPYILYYYTDIYKESQEKIKKLGVCYSYDAFERFYNAGGTITKSELKHLSFNKLKDEDFVLNKQYTPEEIHNEYPAINY